MWIKKTIDIKNLTFRYDNQSVFKNFNAQIQVGEISMITGLNGSGKTTLVNLLTRIQNPPRNSIFFDDTDILDFDIQTLRKRFSYVSQDIKFFYGTLKENLAYSDSYSDESIFKILEKVGLRDYVMKLPEGLETMMGNEGLQFSGGQRQRFAIVQALLSNTDIIIFDEATKSVDAKTEQIIMDMLRDDFEGKTRIIVSHNPDHLKYADNIVSLN